MPPTRREKDKKPPPHPHCATKGRKRVIWHTSKQAVEKKTSLFKQLLKVSFKDGMKKKKAKENGLQNKY